MLDIECISIFLILNSLLFTVIITIILADANAGEDGEHTSNHACGFDIGLLLLVVTSILKKTQCLHSNSTSGLSVRCLQNEIHPRKVSH